MTMVRRRPRWLPATTLLLTLALLAAACGDDDDITVEPDAEVTTPTVTDTSDATATSGTPATTEGATATTEGATGTTGGDAMAAGFPDCDAADGALVGYSEPIPDPNFAIIEAIIQSELDRVGAELQAVNANLDPGKQISDIDTLVGQGVDVLMINPVDPTAVQESLSNVDVPVVVQDTKFGGPYYTNVTADVESAAAAGAARLKELVGDAPVAAINGPPFAEVLVRQAEAFQAAADEVGLNVVETAVNQTITPDGAAEIAAGFKVEYGDELGGIWTFNDTSAVGVASTFDDSFSPALVSINGQPEAIPLLQEEVIDATYDLQQDMIARGLAYAAVSAICGDELPEDVWIESLPLTPENASEWVNPAERGQEQIDLTLEERDGRTFIVEG